MRPGVPTSKIRFHWRLSPFDLLWAIVAPFIALALRDPKLLTFHAGAGLLPGPYQYAFVTFLFSVAAFLFFRLSEGMSRYFSLPDLWSVLGATIAVVALSDVTLFVINRLEGVPRSTPLIYGLVLAGGLLTGRTLARLSRFEPPLDAETENKPNLRRVVLVGVDRFASLVIKLVDCQQPSTTQIVAALDTRERLTGRTINGVKVVGRPGDIEAVIEEYRVHGVDIDEVWLSDHSATEGETAEIERICWDADINVRAISDALNLTPQRGPLFRKRAHEAPIVTPHVGYFRFKRAMDCLAAASLVLILAPVTLLVVGLTYLDVGAPVVFWQRRVGRGGREFFLFKFRTYQALYRKNGERIADEARLSRIGRAIRATRLDEIPQLYNILRGEMSLIGPRPLLPVDQPADPTLRLLVRPGVTGWAQVIGGTTVTAEEKDALDVWYIHHASPLLDAKIIWRTLAIVLRGEKIHAESVKTALHWLEKTRQIDQRLFGEDSLTAANARS